MAVVRDFVLFRLNKVTLFFVLPKRTVDSVVPPYPPGTKALGMSVVLLRFP